MTQRWKQVQEIFQEALDRPAAERRAFVEGATGGDAELLDDVWSLVEASDSGADFLTGTVFDAGELPDPTIGTRLGRYRILEEIGHGGMGAVYRAVRDDDEFEQEVAVKITRAGMDAGHFRSRFLYERQIHAFLAHPNIARLLDGGTTEDGRPYFVMELIEGESIILHGEQQKLGVRAKVALFLQVCAAVEYAHRHMVVHRDLKPSNILIGADGEPKLLDFGIAKLLLPDHPSLEPTQTVEMARVLTPDYASPEQVRGEAINTATDVYSLGLVLYELLTGKKGQEVDTGSPVEMERAICERDPTRPGRLNQELAGDLENIVLKAIEKDAARRYLSVEQFSADLRRYMDGRPVQARGNGRMYRLGKFVLRNKAIVTAVAAVILTLVGGILTTTRQARIAERRFDQVRKLANAFLLEHDALAALPGSTGQRRKLTEQALEYLDVLNRETGRDPALLRELAMAYEKVGDVHGRADGPNLGNTAKALECYEKAIAIREAALETVAAGEAGIAKRDLSEAYLRLASSLKVNGRAREALDIERKALGMRRQLAEADPSSLATRRLVAMSMQSLGVSLSEMGDDIGALDVRRQALAEFEKLFEAGLRGEDDYRALILANTHVASVLSRRKQYGEARTHYERALETARAGVNANPRSNALRSREAVVVRAMASDAMRQGRLEEAEGLARQAKVILRRLAADDPNDFRTHSMLATSHYELARVQDSARHQREALAEDRTGLAMRMELSARDPANAGARIEVAQSFAAIGRLQVAQGARGSGREALLKAREILTELKKNNRTNSVGAMELESVQRALGEIPVSLSK